MRTFLLNPFRRYRIYALVLVLAVVQSAAIGASIGSAQRTQAEHLGIFEDTPHSLGIASGWMRYGNDLGFYRSDDLFAIGLTYEYQLAPNLGVGTRLLFVRSTYTGSGMFQDLNLLLPITYYFNLGIFRFGPFIAPEIYLRINASDLSFAGSAGIQTKLAVSDHLEIGISWRYSLGLTPYAPNLMARNSLLTGEIGWRL